MTAKERPILFSREMVRAILDGHKTQTRRVVKQPLMDMDINSMIAVQCPYGEPGDRLWVRETWAPCGDSGAVWFRAGVPVYRAGRYYSGEWEPYNETFGLPIPDNIRWRPSIFMPRWASRITLEVVNVRVERVQDITEADARAEGMRLAIKLDDAGTIQSGVLESEGGTYRVHFEWTWDSVNYHRPEYYWHNNPWVWVVEFSVVGDHA